MNLAFIIHAWCGLVNKIKLPATIRAAKQLSRRITINKYDTFIYYIVSCNVLMLILDKGCPSLVGVVFPAYAIEAKFYCIF